MRSLKKDRLIFLALALTYLVVAVAYKAAGWTPERVFPFFAWDLFTTVPATAKENVILVREIDGTPLRFPRDLRDYWRPLRHNDPANYFPIPTELAAAVAKGNAAAEKSLLAAIRGRFFLNTKSLGITLLEREYDPLVYWKDRTSGSVRVLKEFHLTYENTVFSGEGTP
jgi:hypothetical protein